MRQPALFDRADRPAVALAPDAAEMLAVDLHGILPFVSRPQDTPRHRIELLQEFGVARLGCRDQRGVERAVRADRTRLMLAWKIFCQPRHQRLGLVGVRGQYADDVL